MSISREDLEFGTGSFVGAALSDPDFYEQSAVEQARIAGWANGCPVVEQLIDPANPDPGRGPEVMLERYGQVNFWFGHIARTAMEMNPSLGQQLLASEPRQQYEPVGKHEPQSVPDTYYDEMTPLGTLSGYALPRLFTKQLGEDLPREESVQRMMRGLQALEIAIMLAETPEQLLALTANQLSGEDVSATTVLSSVLSEGWFSEHNSVTMLDRAKAALQKDAPDLWNVYEGLSVAEKQRYKIV